jgi:hypothetical protein
MASPALCSHGGALCVVRPRRRRIWTQVALLLLLHAAAAVSPPPPGAAVNWAAAALGATATANSAGYWVRAWRACVFSSRSLVRGVR